MVLVNSITILLQSILYRGYCKQYRGIVMNKTISFNKYYKLYYYNFFLFYFLMRNMVFSIIFYRCRFIHDFYASIIITSLIKEINIHPEVSENSDEYFKNTLLYFKSNIEMLYHICFMENKFSIKMIDNFIEAMFLMNYEKSNKKCNACLHNTSEVALCAF